MEPDRLRRVEQLYHSALKVAADQRSAFLMKECDDDKDLRAEVESLLSYESSAAGFIESPAFDVAAKLIAEDKAAGETPNVPKVTAGANSEWQAITPLVQAEPASIGAAFPRFRVLEKLGAGGMGVVYKAEDTKLRRSIALKFLPPEFSRDPQALERFQREAYAASALNHPNICTVHDVDECEGQPFIAMELLEGQTLERRIGAQPLPTPELLELALQISAALDAAHARGMIHRDIKPPNIFITSRGQAKVLDFGLAKLQESEAGDVQRGASTQTQPQVQWDPNLTLTRTGMTIGTAGYMSPEQIRGEKLDARTDLFSFGLVLYEMATGQRAFAKETASILQAAILNETPAPIRKLNPKAPYKLERIINKTLEKDCTARYQSASEVRADLETLKREMEPKRRWGAIFVLILLLAITAAFGFFRRQQLVVQNRPEPKLRQLTVSSFENRVTSGAISPDGKYLAYADINGMYIKGIETGKTRVIPTPDELRNKNVEWEIVSNAWFPDNATFIANANRSTLGSEALNPQENTSIWGFSTLDRVPRKLRDNAVAYSVSPDGSLISFGANKGRIGDREVWLMGLSGEHTRKLYDVDENSAICCLSWSPDEQRVMYIKTDHSGDTFINRDLKGGPPTTIFTASEMKSVNDALWLPDGRLIYSLTESPGLPDTCNYWTMQLGSRTGELIEKPRRLTNWTAGFCMNGTSMTADGKKLALLKWTPHATSYMAEWTAGGAHIPKLSHFPLSESLVVAGWTVDSKEVILSPTRNGDGGIYKQGLNQETAEPLVTEGYDRNPCATPDGKWLLYLGLSENGVGWPATPPQPVMRVPITGGPAQRLFIARPRSLIFCARPPSQLCVIGEPTEDRKQLTVTAIDLLKGRGPELFRFALPANDDTWFMGLSPDGTRVAATQTSAGPIYILSLAGQVLQQVRLKGWSKLLEFTWAADGKGLFVTAGIRNGHEILHVDLQGHAHALWESTGASGETLAIPSPDGRHVAFQSWTTSSNMWMMEDF